MIYVQRQHHNRGPHIVLECVGDDSNAVVLNFDLGMMTALRTKSDTLAVQMCYILYIPTIGPSAKVPWKTDTVHPHLK